MFISGGVRLLILKKSPGGTIIPWGTFIRESREPGIELLSVPLQYKVMLRSVVSQFPLGLIGIHEWYFVALYIRPKYTAMAHPSHTPTRYSTSQSLWVDFHFMKRFEGILTNLKYL